MRKSGILMAVSSLPSKYGIGCFSKEGYEWVDFLAKAGQKFWQILPLGPTGYGDSPYQSFSTFAGNPYYIDLEELIAKGWLSKKECDKVDFGSNERYVDYEKLYYGKFKLLRKAYEKSEIGKDSDFKKFCQAEKNWLADYALYMALKDENKGKSFMEWDKPIRTRKKTALNEARKRLAKDIEYYSFLQYLFMTQWLKLKDYANKKGIEIVGDIPIYVALDSADTWSHPELFQLDKNGYPTGVAGCPPDYFSATGQLWGNPLYDWEYHKKTSFAWWMERLGNCFRLYDMVRIDHFRGFDEYYNIPYGDPTAEFGHWEPGPGYDLFKEMIEVLGDKPVIAEDLGFLTDTVIELVERTGFPGMKILEFAFDSNEDNSYLPHNYNKNCVVYTGTHDNDTVFGWYPTLKRKDQKFLRDYLGIKNTKKLNWELIRLGMASVAETCIIPIQDCIGLGSEGRMNTPSTLGFNWQWRLTEGECTDEIAQNLSRMAKVYGRDGKAQNSFITNNKRYHQ